MDERVGLERRPYSLVDELEEPVGIVRHTERPDRRRLVRLDPADEVNDRHVLPRGPQPKAELTPGLVLVAADVRDHDVDVALTR